MLARERLVFEELFTLQVALLQIKNETVADRSGQIMEKVDMAEFFKALPFEFTSAQKKVFEEIQGDMYDRKVMNRLVQGDVGSGKTAVAMAAAYVAVKNGFQTAMMAPTEVLATQHYESFKDIFEPLGIKVVLITGGLKAKEKREAWSMAATGVADIIIGTHAIIQSKAEFRKLGLVITDEQHRFGVRQRQILSDKGDNPERTCYDGYAHTENVGAYIIRRP